MKAVEIPKWQKFNLQCHTF